MGELCVQKRYTKISYCLKKTKMDGLKFCLFISVNLFLESVRASVIVNTDLGKVEGVEVKSVIKNDKYYSFMGIPYGKAPIDGLRFKVRTQIHLKK